LGVVDRIGLASALKHDIRLKAPEQLQPGICRLVVNGKPCMVPSARRGLCDRHYASIWQRPDLRLDDFALQPRSASDYNLRRPPLPGRCRVVERGTACEETPIARGLCKRHYAWLREHDMGLFERLAEPNRSAIVYSLRTRLPAGICRVAENGHGCGRAVWARGLCDHHYALLCDKREVFLQIALPTKKKPAAVLACKVVSEPNTCHLLENGVPCMAPVEHRGLCMRHYRCLRVHVKYRLADFLLPVPEPVYARKPLVQLNSAICRIVQDGQPCQESAFSRGLCRHHHRALQRLGKIDDFGAAPRAASGLNRRVPAAYLDKNVVFDWCDSQAFSGVGQQASCDLVERVRSGRMVATISASAVTSTYNHLRHRASRPEMEGGRGLAEDASEALARSTLSRMLEGTWRILSLSAHDLRSILVTAPASRSYEDALEWAAYQEARKGQHGPRWFVTRDGDFPEGIPPWTVEQHLRDQAKAP